MARRLQPRVVMRLSAGLLSAITVCVMAAGCGQGQGVSPKETAALAVPAPTVAAAAAATPSKPINNDYVPAEFQTGKARYKETGVYVDGKPVGILSFGELPVTLKPFWRGDEARVPFKYGSTGPRTKIIYERFYRFDQYLESLGVDLRKVKEVHVYATRDSETIVVSGAELRRRGKEFLFRFGSSIYGKPLPRVPANFGNGRSPDKITMVAVYIEKKPPKMVYNQGFELDGKPVTGVPYYGERLRGGVRVYLDDRLAAYIKRKQLESSTAAMVKGTDGVARWKLFDFLAAQGVDTSKIVEAWVIKQDQRAQRISRAELERMTFEASPQAKGEILLGDQKYAANALALHTRPVRPEELPEYTEEEREVLGEIQAGTPPVED